MITTAISNDPILGLKRNADVFEVLFDEQKKQFNLQLIVKHYRVEVNLFHQYNRYVILLFD